MLIKLLGCYHCTDSNSTADGKLELVTGIQGSQVIKSQVFTRISVFAHACIIIVPRIKVWEIEDQSSPHVRR